MVLEIEEVEEELVAVEHQEVRREGEVHQEEGEELEEAQRL